MGNRFALAQPQRDLPQLLTSSALQEIFGSRSPPIAAGGPGHPGHRTSCGSVCLFGPQIDRTVERKAGGASVAASQQQQDGEEMVLPKAKAHQRRFCASSTL
ncbi:uncharacterized protein N7482_007791 [Penicillium canariense]|uniref:Uncharacterized protein n=1 Tax=Penicillium canariense TaxID=189055 RepID=A0A9W9LJH8_9EURO|nr:uncharacterized protein N7482_007791 [Penicillium canariense]KAJ5160787.1 hypothetical protein N7482_007791 [Penicillium canariense]